MFEPIICFAAFPFQKSASVFQPFRSRAETPFQSFAKGCCEHKQDSQTPQHRKSDVAYESTDSSGTKNSNEKMNSSHSI
jgi:hypothetical protein